MYPLRLIQMERVQCQRIDSLMSVFYHKIDIFKIWPHLFHTELLDRDNPNIPELAAYLTNPNTILDIVTKVKKPRNKFL